MAMSALKTTPEVLNIKTCPHGIVFVMEGPLCPKCWQDTKKFLEVEVQAKEYADYGDFLQVKTEEFFYKPGPVVVEIEEQFFLLGVSESTGCNCHPVAGSDRARMGEHHQNECPMRCSCLDVWPSNMNGVFIRCPYHEVHGRDIPLIEFSEAVKYTTYKDGKTTKFYSQSYTTGPYIGMSAKHAMNIPANYPMGKPAMPVSWELPIDLNPDLALDMAKEVIAENNNSKEVTKDWGQEEYDCPPWKSKNSKI